MIRKLATRIYTGVCYMWCANCQRDTCHKASWSGWTCTEHVTENK